MLCLKIDQCCLATILTFANDIFQVLKDTFTMDYQRTLKFPNIPDEMDVVTQQPDKSVKITIPEADEILKGCFRYILLLIVKLQLLDQFALNGLLSVKSSVAQSS